MPPERFHTAQFPAKPLKTRSARDCIKVLPAHRRILATIALNLFQLPHQSRGFVSYEYHNPEVAASPNGRLHESQQQDTRKESMSGAVDTAQEQPTSKRTCQCRIFAPKITSLQKASTACCIEPPSRRYSVIFFAACSVTVLSPGIIRSTNRFIPSGQNQLHKKRNKMKKKTVNTGSLHLWF